MKKILGLISVAIIVTSCTQTKETKSPLDGVWQIVYFQQANGDSILGELGKQYKGSEIKIWSGNHFNFVGQYTLEDSIINNFGTGTCKLEGNRYEEYLTYPDQVTVKLLLEIKGDTLFQEWPADDNGIIATGDHYKQKWVRLE